MKNVSLKHIFVFFTTFSMLQFIMVAALWYLSFEYRKDYARLTSITKEMIINSSRIRESNRYILERLFHYQNIVDKRSLNRENEELIRTSLDTLDRYKKLLEQKKVMPFDENSLRNINDEALIRFLLIEEAIQAYPNIPSALFVEISHSSKRIQENLKELYTNNFHLISSVDKKMKDIYLVSVVVFLAFLAFSIVFTIFFYKNIVVPFRALYLLIKKNDHFYISRVKKIKTIFTELMALLNILSLVSENFYILYREVTKNVDIQSKFLNIISHDLRTPLGVIIGNLELLKSEEIIKSSDVRLNDSYLSACSLQRIFDSSLTLSAIDKSKKNRLIPVDFCNLTQTLSSLLFPSLVRKQVTLQFFYSANLPKELLLTNHNSTQVLLNLIDNAIKACSENDQIRVRFRVNLNTLVMTVFDSGGGIAKEALPRLMLPLEQGVGSKEGIGLGTYITSRLVASMKGRLSVVSKVGKGSFFVVRVPFETTNGVSVFDGLRSDTRSLRKLYSQGSHLVKSQNHGRIYNILGGRINDEEVEQIITCSTRALLVEDFALNRDLFLRIAKRVNLEVTTVPNGSSALRELDKSTFDVVFMDLQLPDINGIEVTQRVRAKGDQTPIVGLTASSSEELSKRCLTVGMNYFLSKPLSIDNLRSVLNEITAAR